ncbi:MAG: oligosaccharide flippase family protein [Eubacteriales bacterium]|nr:oligosaccharide flippase family protein [Eubacteriales bacterium]
MKTTDGRIQKSMKNMIFSMSAYIITILLSFVERKVFVMTLPEEYLGISGVMTNILTILTISELGLGEAIMFSMYKPIREKDQEKIIALLNMYKSAYRVIVLVIVAISAAFLPFLPRLIGSVSISLEEEYLIYALFVINTLDSYFGAYRRSTVIAYQERYVVSAIHGIARSIMYLLQIIILVLLRNYLLSLCIAIISTFSESLAIYHIAGVRYPVTKTHSKNKLPKDERKEIYRNIRAMAIHKLGGTCVTGTDNLLISWFVGVVQVGLYSNYVLIKSTIVTITQSIFTSMAASMGNLGNEDKSYSYTVFNRIYFASSWLFGWCSVCLLCLYQNFISLWVGSNFLLDSSSKILIVISFYLTGMRQPVLMTREAFGLFWDDRWKAVAEAIVNLVASIALARVYGLNGIIMGTIISTLVTCFWVEPYILFVRGFKRSCAEYFMRYMKYSFAMLVSYFATDYLCGSIVGISYLGFAIKIVICLVIPNIIYYVFSFRQQEFKYFSEKFLRKIFKK